MTIKINRESILVILTAIMVLIGLAVYGNSYLIKPVKEDAEFIIRTVNNQKSLIAGYPPSEDLLEEKENELAEIDEMLPFGVRANQALVTLEELASRFNVNLSSVSRVAGHQSIEEVPEDYVKDIYSLQISSDHPRNFRRLIDSMMTEQRIWNIVSFTYSKADEENYSGTLDYELYYRIDFEQAESTETEE